MGFGSGSSSSVFELFFILPLSFWVVVALLIGGGSWAFSHRRDAWGLPTLAVLVTVAFWYVGDAWYNDYAEYHTKVFEAAILRGAWWQVVWFLIVFIVATPPIHLAINRRHLATGSGVMRLFQLGVNQPGLQYQLRLLLKGSVLIWLTLGAIAALRLKEQIPYYFFPFLGYKAEPWGRGRIGAGYDALLTVAYYFQLLVAGIFGVVAALATERRTRTWALIFCLLAWPYFIFDRTRNTMLAAVIPGVLSYALLRVRGGGGRKAAVLVGAFVLINAWMTFIIANRSMSITAAFKEKGFSLVNRERIRHEGLNMFEELCWINSFMAQGSYDPNWGRRYFAEAVNMIPRSLWPGKPLIGIDYAVARGQAGASDEAAGVYATISTGMIGQGVVNFGRWLGPMAAALLMSLWVAVLARWDLQIHRLGRLPLYATGLILTFNLGRDITLITLYPLVFGCLVVWAVERFNPSADALGSTPLPRSHRRRFRGFALASGPRRVVALTQRRFPRRFRSGT